MNSKTFLWLFALLLLVYFLGFPVTIMDVDSGQYASISREMAETGNYLQVMSHGRDYLDKPPLLFWVTALMFNIFGYANWSFKIGSFLFTLLGVYSTFRLGKLLYSSSVGRLAAIILFSCQAFILFNNDVRTDTILTSSVVFAIWQMMEWYQTKKWKWIVGAALGISFAMMAKGPIGIMVPVLAIGSWIVGQGRWKDIIKWQYLVLLALVAVMLAPMLYGLYTQFDLQPEKSVGMVTPHGIEKQTNVSGLKFYLWTQSFGRITGENVWKNNTGPFFFVHNFLWSFLPWALVFLLAFFSRIRQLVLSLLKKAEQPELLTLGGFILPFIALSMSAYKLPHYIFVVYPLAAILLASWWVKLWEFENKAVKNTVLILQSIIWLAFTAAVVLIHFWVFKGGWFIASMALVVQMVALWFLIRSSRRARNLIVAVVLSAVAGNLSMNGWFYPKLMDYQAGSNAAMAVKNLNLDPAEVYNYRFHTFTYYYYRGEFTQSITPALAEKKLAKGENVYVVTDEKGVKALGKTFEYATLHAFGTHSITKLSGKFLNPKTRNETLQKVSLIQIIGKKENLKFADENQKKP